MRFLLFILALSFIYLPIRAQFPGCPDVDAGVDQTTACPGVCTTLTAQPIVSGLTTSYTASAISHTPPIAYNAPGGNPISVATDDVWSPLIQLPFNFCYYGQTYTTCRVGSNGAIRLGSGGGGNHPWQFNSFVPSNNLVSAGNIFGVYHDIDPSVPVAGGGQVRWYLLGDAPCRIFVVSFLEMAHFSCNNLRSTHMMVLYETTNVIDVYVEKKQTCSNWNNGNAVIGIQNVNGTQGVAAPGRNTGPWSVITPEAWRFSPAGTPTYTVSWFQNGQLISNNLSIEVCPTNTTTYTASVTYTPCAGGNPVTVTDDVTVNVNQGVVPSFGSLPSNYCVGSIIPNLPTTSLNGITGTWSPALNNQQTTTYTFTPNPNQCASAVNHTINISPSLTPNFSFPTSFCTGQNIPPLPSTSNNGIQGSWSPAPNNQQTTTYTFTPNPNQCANPTQITISISNFETPIFGNFGPYCQGDFVPNLPGTSINGITGTWSPPINNQQTTSYTFNPDAGSCALGNAQLTIEIQSNILPYFDSYPTYCIHSQIPQLPSTSINNISGIWSPPINNQQTTTYTFTATDLGCYTPATMTVEILNTTQSTDYVNYCSSNLPYFWNGLALTQNGLYESLFTGSNGCDSVAQLVFSVVQVPESMTIINVCEQDLPLIWNGLSITTSGSYNSVLLSNSGCDSIAYLSAHVRIAPDFDFISDRTEACGSMTGIFTVLDADPYVEALWNFGNGSLSHSLNTASQNFDSPGCFDVSLQLTNQFGCHNTKVKSDYICVFPNPVASFIASPSYLDNHELTAKFINFSTNATSYLWDFGHNDATSTVTNGHYTYPDVPGQYQIWLTAMNEFGCIDSTSRFVEVNIAPLYYIPNTFTPDGDSFNGTFLPVFSSGFDPYSFNMCIFNRWGEIVFESNNALVGWDGTYGGKLMQDGVYIYRISFKDLHLDKRYEVTGHVNLIR